MNNKDIILDLCAGTGAWSLPYRQAGYDVLDLDIKNNNDIRLFVMPNEPEKNVIGVLASPPCTHLAGSGARYWKEKGDAALLEALSVVDACMRIITVTKPEWWALENPVGRLYRYLGKPKLIFNPCDYGDPYTKKTCLWGNFNIPEKNPVKPVKACSQGSWIQKLGGKSERTKTLRSITPSGFAKAFFEANR